MVRCMFILCINQLLWLAGTQCVAQQKVTGHWSPPALRTETGPQVCGVFRRRNSSVGAGYSRVVTCNLLPPTPSNASKNKNYTTLSQPFHPHESAFLSDDDYNCQFNI